MPSFRVHESVGMHLAYQVEIQCTCHSFAVLRRGHERGALGSFWAELLGYCRFSNRGELAHRSLPALIR
jgi:hypothetical protein